MLRNFVVTLVALLLGAVVLWIIAGALGKRGKAVKDVKKSKRIRDGVISSAVIGMGCVLAVVGILIWYAPIHAESAKYNLTYVRANPDELPIMQEQVDEGYVELSDMTMHYVKYGTKGHEVVLIHGNGGSTESLKTLAKYLASDYTVYCIDDRCQGKSSDPGVITYELMAKDVSEFIAAKKLQKPYVLGHSDGGMVGIALAANYPESLGALISCGSNSNPATFKAYFTIGVQFNNIKHPDKLNNLMLTEPDFTPEYLARITCPTYIVAGEFDIMPLSDSVYIHENISGSEIAIMKWGDHGSYFGQDNRDIYVFAKAYFDRIGN